MRKVKIAIDFDGTVVEHRYPQIGKTNDNCVEILKKWVDNYDVHLILSTMRCDDELNDAIEWFKERDIPLYGIQKDPTQETWTSSPKCNAMFCIDDRNVGTPLKKDSGGVRYMVDWKKLNKMFEPTLKSLSVL